MFTAESMFWFVLALVLAAIEIEIEGKRGWAEKIPTWYRTTGFSGKLYGFAMNGKPLTGYHLFMIIFTVMVFHIPFFSGTKWSAGAELSVLAIYFVWCPVWDYLWFILNPHYGVKNFKRENIWWHTKSYWILNLFPLDYVIGLGLSVILAYLASLLTDNSALNRHIWLICSFFTLTLITVLIIAPLYKSWHKAMRQRDDRNKAEIFHV